jgi:hypothetical protein
MRPEVLAVVSTKITRLRYDNMSYDKTLRSFKMSVHLYQITRRHTPKDGNFETGKFYYVCIDATT